MPEGPEIHRAADAIAKAIDGRRIEHAELHLPRLTGRAKDLTGRRVTSVRARGKAITIAFDHGLTLYSHNQLYGVWKIVKAGQRPRTARALRVALETDDSAALLYSASDIALIRSEAIDAHPYLARLGPDVIDADVTEADVLAQLDDPRFRGRQLAALLLDQSFLAGMGNYLRSEVLHAAGIDAGRRPRELDDGERGQLARALLDVPRRSYRSRGVKRSRAKLRGDLQVDHGDAFRFRVFGRAGEPCEACGASIEKVTLAGRRLYRCSDCQR